ncbi:hypothetical protein [Streptomyces sp. NBC_00525]|uniref:hypothetical protein n=1 Tax=Streptomyces sp. NBC_00525 TaxID=2903660 RepID=UPI002E81069A|nr:hypothetical protein [Streptomyces sp. NBC_00525]WUC96445.1 hypothetical protein OG710_23840 [Streptomyces sp. NBC_00525]
MDKGSSIPDEEWERFLREAEAGTGDAPEEPSARARMVTRRLDDEPAPPPGWRVHEPPRRRNGKRWYVVGLIVVVALFGLTLSPGLVNGWFGGGTGGDSAGASGRATLDAPFKGSPAEHWATGTAGITMPSAHATGWMSEKQVDEALESSLAFLVDSGLDPAVLRGKRPVKAIAALNPEQADVEEYLAHAFDRPSRGDDPLLLFSRFDPSYVRLAGDVIRTRGRITYRAGDRGAVDVTADVTFVYPVVRAEGDSDEVARTIVRREIVMSWENPAEVEITPGTFSLRTYRMDAANGGCGDTTGYFVPEFGKDRGPSEEGARVDPYERDMSMDERMRDRDASECGTATRT